MAMRKRKVSGAPYLETCLPRIAIVDSLASCRIGLTKHMLSTGKLRIAWASATAREGFEKMASDTPDLLIVEIQLTGQDGLEFIKNLRPLYPTLRILVHSSLNEDFYARRCLQAGAMGFLHKTEPMSLLLPAIETILRGDVHLSKRTASETLLSMTTSRRQSNQRLTDRELEVIMLMAQGHSCQETSDKLVISPRTVQVHRTNIRKKLGLDSAARLHAYAIRFYSDALISNPDPVKPDIDGEKPLSRRNPASPQPKYSGKVSHKPSRKLLSQKKPVEPNEQPRNVR